jgi:hypothetical protein
MLKKKNPPMILKGHLTSVEQTLRATNHTLKDIWIELTVIDRRLRTLKDQVKTLIDGEGSLPRRKARSGVADEAAKDDKEHS